MIGKRSLFLLLSLFLFLPDDSPLVWAWLAKDCSAFKAFRRGTGRFFPGRPMDMEWTARFKQGMRNTPLNFFFFHADSITARQFLVPGYSHDSTICMYGLGQLYIFEKANISCSITFGIGGCELETCICEEDGSSS